ncbi:hypothetical protein [Shinella kummerowiae]|uniref:hypothetical protein n=1 Tax=Shinella kummerowiae TaxID=417745 RepID=UPI0021B4F027|nr:hypothetical protein [Shinella kummerowiae]MCT7663528.1 hypothetical protein [Shinella kummerowiae]
MESVRALLESEEVKLVVSAIEALREKTSKQQTSAVLQFHELVLGEKFQAAEVLAILLDNETYYPGLKPILTAGFAGWLIDPDKQYNALRFDAMCRAAMAHMSEAEKRAGLTSRRWDVKRDVIARYIFTGTDFLREIYDELGGYNAFQDASSLEIAGIVTQSEITAINTVLRAMAYFHHGADLWGKGATLPPSLNRAVLMLSGLKEGLPNFSDHYVSRSLLHKRWTASKSTLALIYAADSIKVKDETLFKIILAQKLSYDQHKKYFSRWVCRARYVSSHIFSCATDPELRDESDKILANGDVERFSPPPLTPVEIKLLEKHFIKPVASAS